MTRTIWFTDFDTVMFSTVESITKDKFFKVLENNIESDEYGVIYHQEDNSFVVRYHDYEYGVLLNNQENENIRKGITSPITRKLLTLSQIQSLVDIQNGNKKLMNGYVLDNDAKRIYLDKLKRSRAFNLKKYIVDLIDDIKTSESETYVFIDTHMPLFNKNDFWGSEDKLLRIGLILAVLSTDLIQITENPWWILYAFLSPQLYLLIFPLIFIGEQTKNRFIRLIEYYRDNKEINGVINNLNKSINNTQRLIEEKEDNVIELEEKLSDEDIQLVYDIVQTIDQFIVDLKKRNPSERREIREEINIILNMYKDINNTNKSLRENEIHYNYPELDRKIASLQLKINDAIKRNSDKERDAVIEYLEEKLDADEDDLGYQKSIGTRKQGK